MSSWFDRFNKVWASGGLRDDPTDAQANAGWAYIGQAPPTVEQFNATNQWWDYKDNWLYNQIAQVIIAGGMVPSESDITQLLQAIRNQQRVRLSAPLTLFVDAANGNDTNSGSVNAPFKTIQRGIRYFTNDIDIGGQQAALQLAPGTYDPVTIVAPALGQIIVSGDRLNPRNYLIKNTNGTCVYATGGCRVHFQGISLEAVGADADYTTWGVGFTAVYGSIISFMDVAFGPCSLGHMYGGSAGMVTIADIGLSYSIYGGAQYHMTGGGLGECNIARSHVTILNNPNFVNAFAVASECGVIQAWSCTFTGTSTGKRYAVNATSTVHTNGGGANYLPGNAAGWTDLASFGAYV